MMRSKRMGANADGPHGRRQDERGVTLIELLVVIGILAVLTAVAVSTWRVTQERNRAERAIEQIASAMALARIKARATGQAQTVEVDFTNSRFRTQAWAGAQTGWRSVRGVQMHGPHSPAVGKGVTLLEGRVVGKACVPGKVRAGIKTFTFTPRGTVRVTGSGRGFTIMARTAGGRHPVCLVVNNITGRARIVRP